MRLAARMKKSALRQALPLLAAVLLVPAAAPMLAGQLDPLVLADSAGTYKLDRHVAIALDESQRLTIGDLATQPQLFEPLETPALNLGYSNAAVWLRFRLSNPAPGQRQWLLDFDNATLSRISLFVEVAADSFSQQHFGSLRPFAERPLKHPRVIIPLDLPPQSTTTFYCRLFSHEPVRIAPRLYSPTAFYRMDHDAQMLLGVFYGMMLIFVLYNFVLFLSIRDRAYLYLVLFVASGCIAHMLLDGIAYEFLWPASPRWNQEARAIFGSLLAIWGLLFSRHILNSPVLAPRLDRLMVVAMLLGWLMIGMKMIYLAFPESSQRAPGFFAAGVGLTLLAGAAALPKFAVIRRLFDRSHYPILLQRGTGASGAFLLAGGLIDMDIIYFSDRLINTLVPLFTVASMLIGGLIAWRRGHPPARSFLLGTSGIAIGLFVFVLLHIGILPNSPWTANSVRVGIVVGMPLFSLAIGDHINLLRKQMQEASLKAVELRRQAIENLQKSTQFKLDALQAKINPHFLFNTLNSIANLISENPEKAEVAVERLAQLFRYTLRRSARGLVRLADELDIVRHYLQLEQLRFESRLAFAIHTSGDIDAVRVPALLLQPLAENSVKYAVANRKDGGTIDIAAMVNNGRCTLVVRDDGPGWVEQQPASGYGLENVRERLSLTYGADFRLRIEKSAGVCVEIEIPVEVP